MNREARARNASFLAAAAALGAVHLWLVNYFVPSVAAFAGCSKSPTAVVMAAADTVGQRLMQPQLDRQAAI